MKPQELGLNCEALDEFRQSVDTALKILIDRMTEKDMETGTVTAKIKISVHTEMQDNGNQVRIVKMEPDVGLKIGAMLMSFRTEAPKPGHRPKRYITGRMEF